TGPRPPEFRDGDPPRVAQKDPLEAGVAVDQDADLAADLVGEFREEPGQLVGDDLVGRHAAAENPLESLDLGGFESAGVAVDLVDSVSASVPSITVPRWHARRI